jgi:hypothetical protein
MPHSNAIFGGLAVGGAFAHRSPTASGTLRACAGGAPVCEALCGRLSKPFDARFNFILAIGHNIYELARFKRYRVHYLMRDEVYRWRPYFRAWLTIEALFWVIIKL